MTSKEYCRKMAPFLLKESIGTQAKLKKTGFADYPFDEATSQEL